MGAIRDIRSPESRLDAIEHLGAALADEELRIVSMLSADANIEANLAVFSGQEVDTARVETLARRASKLVIAKNSVI